MEQFSSLQQEFRCLIPTFTMYFLSKEVPGMLFSCYHTGKGGSFLTRLKISVLDIQYVLKQE